MANKKLKIKKITVRDYNGVLNTAKKLADDMPSKTSLNSYIIDAIDEKNKRIIANIEYNESIS